MNKHRAWMYAVSVEAAEAAREAAEDAEEAAEAAREAAKAAREPTADANEVAAAMVALSSANKAIAAAAMKAAAMKDLKKYKLGNPRTFRYLNQSNCFELVGVDDAKEYLDTRRAVAVVGLSSDEQDAIFRVVAAILHLGNIEFAKGEELDSSKPKDEKYWFHLRTAAELFMYVNGAIFVVFKWRKTGGAPSCAVGPMFPSSITKTSGVGSIMSNSMTSSPSYSASSICRLENETDTERTDCPIIVSRYERECETSFAVYYQAIKEKILSLDYGESRAEIKTVDAQESFGVGGGEFLYLLLDALLGKMRSLATLPRPFFLAPQDKGYFVLNDAFRYVEDVTFHEGAQVPVNEIENPLTTGQDMFLHKKLWFLKIPWLWSYLELLSLVEVTAPLASSAPTTANDVPKTAVAKQIRAVAAPVMSADTSALSKDAVENGQNHDEVCKFEAARHGFEEGSSAVKAIQAASPILIGGYEVFAHGKKSTNSQVRTDFQKEEGMTSTRSWERNGGSRGGYGRSGLNNSDQNGKANERGFYNRGRIHNGYVSRVNDRRQLGMTATRPIAHPSAHRTKITCLFCSQKIYRCCTTIAT
ncbi:hypothetical protein QQ045_021203 [Rhodiola kirilowii]